MTDSRALPEAAHAAGLARQAAAGGAGARLADWIEAVACVRAQRERLHERESCELAVAVDLATIRRAARGVAEAEVSDRAQLLDFPKPRCKPWMARRKRSAAERAGTARNGAAGAARFSQRRTRGRPVDIRRVGRARGFARQEPRTAPARQEACGQRRLMSEGRHSPVSRRRWLPAERGRVRRHGDGGCNGRPEPQARRVCRRWLGRRSRLAHAARLLARLVRGREPAHACARQEAERVRSKRGTQ